MIAARSRALPTCSSWLQAILPRALAVPEILQPVAVPAGNNTASQCSVPTQSASQHKYSSEQQHHAWIAPIAAARVDLTRPGAWPVPQSVWSHMLELQAHQMRHMGTALSRVRVPKAVGINDTVMPNTTTLKYGQYGIRALTSKRVAANTIEAVRRTLRRRLKKTAALWVRIEATVPVTRKPEGIRMGKGKGAIEFYACPVRQGQIIFEMDRVPRKVALSALEAIQPKFPCQLGFVEWN